MKRHLETSLTVREGQTPASAPNARSRHPVFKGQRLVVFDWQLEDLTRLLGSNTDAFDLHAWLYELDARAAKSDAVIPQRDSGKWLQDQTLLEAQRRGLAIAVTTPAPTAGKQTTRLAAALANITRSQS